MIFGVALEVVGQLRDPAGEERNLHIRAAGVLLVELKLLHVHRVTAICHKRVRIVGEEHVLARGVLPGDRMRIAQRVQAREWFICDWEWLGDVPAISSRT